MGRRPRRPAIAATLLLVAATISPPDSVASTRKRLHEREPPAERDDLLDHGVQWLQEHDTLLSFDLGLYEAYASRVIEGGNNAATFNWQLFADHRLWAWDGGAELHLVGTLLGTVGLDYDPETEFLSARVGSISTLNGNVYPDPIAIDEIYLEYLSDEGDWKLSLGQLDMSWFFDTNRVANDPYRQFIAYTFENDISIPFPLYGGFGLLGRWDATDDVYVMASVNDASSDTRVPWQGVSSGNWWELVECGVSTNFAGLGIGNYRLTGWHSDSGIGNGFGISLNLDQDLGRDWLVGFLRAGTGDPAQTSVRTAISGGVAMLEPFGRPHDATGLALSWAAPSTTGRDEMFVETYYRITLTKRLAISPDVQIVVNPSSNPNADVSVVANLRLLYAL